MTYRVLTNVLFASACAMLAAGIFQSQTAEPQTDLNMTAAVAVPRSLDNGLMAETGIIEVGPHETLRDIAQRYHVDVQALMATNDLDTETVHPGQEIYLPPY